ncbi:MAG: alpha-mannosidase [Tannerella sp.]|jgi:alpha-mannosidase|nr:alpha-mannosidase [Tannerella sp.]
MKKIAFCFSFLVCLSVVCKAQTADKPKAYMVSNAHLDTQWLWTVQTTIDDYLRRTMLQNFWLIEHYPDYIFNFEGAVKYSWMKEYYPEDYEKLKEYVKAGKWNISGSSWDATDVNMPSPESLFRGILLGQEFYKREFGVKGNDLFYPDCFGFGYALPTIASHAGLIGFSTQKLQWRKFPFYGDEKLPFLFGMWEGIDGARILSVAHAQDYISRFENKDLSNDQKLIELGNNGINRTVYHYYGVGDRGGSPSISSVASIEKGIKGDGPVQIISAPSGKFFDDYLPFGNHPELPVFKGELLMDVHATGCYTSQAAMKRFNRRNEQLADLAERASVVAEWLGGISYPGEKIRQSWERFLWHQFHDDMTGTSIPSVYTFSWNDELISQTSFTQTATAAVGAVGRALDTRAKGAAVIVYNPVAFGRADVVEATIDMSNRPKGVVATRPDGKTVPAQLAKWENGKATVLFPAQVEPVGFSVYDIKNGSASGNPQLKISDRTIENRVYKIELNDVGDIKSIFDKRAGRELIADGKTFRLALFTENESMSWPAWELFKKTVDAEPVSIVDNSAEISVAESGPVRATLKIKRSFEQSTFVQYISLTDGGADDRIDISCEVDWSMRNALLKAEFPMSVANKKAKYDLGTGFIERGNNTETAYEVVAQQWADITSEDNSYGISIINDCKYGWDKPSDNTLRLTLLHTPKVGTDPNMTHQDHLDHGHHTFRYAVIGHASSPNDAQTAWKSEAFNQPLISFTTPKHPGKLGNSFSFVSSNLPQIAVKALKKSEDGQCYILRINEISGADYSNAEISFAAEIESVQEANGIEEPFEATLETAGNKFKFQGKAFQPKTFRVKLKSNNLLSKPANIHLDVPYNATAVTPDDFNKAGNFDGNGNSFSAELLPNHIDDDGVTFAINNRPDEYNYVRCNEQVVALPENHGGGNLYLLVTSSRGDRLASFSVDGAKYDFKIPYYSGFYGQWGWTGESEGFLKDAPIAWLGTHRHSSEKGNESYTFTYLYKVCIPVEKGAKAVTLPKDAGVALFAATISNNGNDNVKAAVEMRAMPHTTKAVEYTDVPVSSNRRR